MSAIDRLFTSVTIKKYPDPVKFTDALFMTGSCFSEHIGRKLSRYKYNVRSNPFGILYNPAAMAYGLERISKQQFYQAEELVLQDGLYHSMDHHGSFSSMDKERVIEKINGQIESTISHLQKTRIAFISPGTSKVYVYQPTGRIAGNNHKIPSSSFTSQILTVDDCLTAFRSIRASLLSIAPSVRFVWTVSPVRHLRDGMIENQRSKATLILAIQQLLAHYPQDDYFPAYEIMMDQLRDYRYYAKDLVHPSDLAIDIIWDFFCETYVDPAERDHLETIEKIKKGMEHRFLHGQREGIKSFAEAQLRNIDQMAALYPEMDWKEERQYFFQLIEPD
jgi:hypothetical protein